MNQETVRRQIESALSAENPNDLSQHDLVNLIREMQREHDQLLLENEQLRQALQNSPSDAIPTPEPTTSLPASEVETLFDAMIVPVTITRNSDGLFLYKNEAADELFKFPRDGSPVYATDYYADAKSREGLSVQLEQQGRLAGVELLTVDHDGNYIWVICSTTMIEFMGETCRLSALIDITENKRLDTERRRNIETLELLTENAGDLIALHNRDSTYVFVSPSSERILGYKPDELIGVNPFTMVHPDDLAMIREEARNLIQQEYISKPMTYRIRKKDGTYIWFETHLRAITDTNNITSQYVSVSYNVTDRRHIEEELRQERQLLRNLIDVIPDHIFIKDTQDRYLLVNNYLLQSFGLSNMKTLIGRRPADIIDDPERKLAIQDDFESVMRGVPVLNREYEWFEPGTEKTLWMATSKFPMRDEHGEIIGLVGVSRDITERKEIEHELRRERHLLQTIIDAIPIDIFFKDTERRYVLVNQSMLRTMGVDSPEEIIGKTAAEIVDSPELLRGIEQDFVVVMQGVAIRDVEYEISDDISNQHGWRVRSKYPIFDDDGEIIGLVGMTRDITDRKTAELQLRDSERFFRAILDGQMSPIAVLDGTGTIINVNGRWRGYNLKLSNTREVIQSIGANYFDIYRQSNRVNPADTQAIIEGIQQIYAWKSAAFYHEFALASDSDTDVVIWFGVQVTRFYENKQVRLIVTHTDVSESKKLHMDLLEALESERELNLLKSQFVSMVSHDFRTPLAAIKTTVEILQRYSHELDADQRLERLQRIDRSVDYLDAMLEDIIYIGKAQMGQIEPNPRPLDLVDFSISLINEVELAYQANGRIELDINNGHDFRMLDEKLLHRILINLLSNAIKYSPKESPVRFTVIAEPDESIFIIEDFGMGIPEPEQTRLFELFFRASNAKNIKGTGLGMVIVKETVESCKGRLDFKSEVGRGTTFTVWMPDLV